MNFQTLSEYVKDVMDRNQDGRVNFKDFLALFPNNATAIAVVFVDLLVAAAEYRVWDVGMQMTHDPLKAAGFVLVSAVPFYLGQIFWLNPNANGIQKWIATGMVATALYTSWTFGTADLTQSYDVSAIVSMVVDMTAAYVLGVLGYILIDDAIKANRLAAQSAANAAQERKMQTLARGILTDLQETMRLEKETADMFGGDPQLVRDQMMRLRGVKPERQHTQSQPQQTRQFAHTGPKPLQIVPTDQKADQDFQTPPEQ